MKRLACIAMAALLLADCSPAPVSYPYTATVVQRRATLRDNLLNLLPAEQRGSAAAVAEATWLADTCYKAAAAISRVNDSHFPGWAGNALINSRFQDRGLCWHYQHDMFRELRRRSLSFFRVGCCVRDEAEATEHNCVFIAAKGAQWPDAWIIDAWMWNGRLKVDPAAAADPDRWHESARVCRDLESVFPENHTYPVEFWGMVRTASGKYSWFWVPESQASEQYKRMLRNIADGEKEHPGTLVNY
ncbi:MAG: hypothetical protein Q4F30_10405 [Akkermansia sp.]|nr:hypothetical protein [Akkermansia sp.]